MLPNCKAYYLIISFLFVIVPAAVAQDQKLADSLAVIYSRDTAQGISKLELLRNLAFNEIKNLSLGIKYADELIAVASEYNNDLYLHRGHMQKGHKKRMLGDLEEALECYFKSVDAAKKANFKRGEGNAYGTIADVYSLSKNHSNAMLYYNKSIATLRKSDDSISLATFISNAGDEYLNHKEYDSALIYFKEAKTIFERVDYSSGIGYCLGNIGMVYANTGFHHFAEEEINKAIKILELAGDYYPICVYLISMSNIYMEKGDRKTAMNYANRSLKLAEQYGLKEQISDANLKLSELHNLTGDVGKAFHFFKSHIRYKDSVNDVKSVQKMADLRTDYEVSQKQVEVDLLNQKSENQRIVNLSLFAILGLAALVLATLYWYYRAIAREKRRSENLLLNILPGETAKELKRNGSVEAVRFENVTVLFTDFVDFTRVAEQVAPEQLVKSIDFYFKAFDHITTKWGLEKIKTIGDSYMCASGLPALTIPPTKNALMAAQEMVEFVKTHLHAQDGLSHFDIRIGLHTGAVVAGIVGSKKWQYDIWGDTVNIASRMESKSMPGRINLSETTYQQIKDEFPCEYRGEIEVKNRGTLKMYFANL